MPKSMNRSHRSEWKSVTASAASVLALVLVEKIEAQTVPPVAPMTARLTEWTVPWPGTRPRDPSVAPDGSIWLVGQQGNYAARFDTATKQFQRFNLTSGAGPHTIFVDSLGRPWYTGNTATHIGRINPATGVITSFPTTVASDPHTITFARDGGLWFTAQNANRIGRLDTVSGQVQLLTPPTASSRPYGIDIAPDGMIWAVLFGTNKLARIDPTQRTLTEIDLPRASARPRRIAITQDGAIWYVDYAGGRLGRHDPKTNTTKEWLCPSGASAAPYSTTVDDRDRIWLVETGPQPNRLVGFDPASETFATPLPIASGGLTVRHMVFDRKTRSVWFATDANTLVRASLTDDAPVRLLDARVQAPMPSRLNLRNHRAGIFKRKDATNDIAGRFLRHFNAVSNAPLKPAAAAEINH